MTKNGQNMAKIEKIRKMQIIDNKEDKFFYFPMISMPCTGSGYNKTGQADVCQCLTGFCIRPLLIVRFPDVSFLNVRTLQRACGYCHF